jgi:hypothetical protein
MLTARPDEARTQGAKTMIAEIRYDHMTDRALIDEESTVALRTLSAGWANKLHPTVARAKRRQALLQRSWRAMAELRTNMPIPLIRRASKCTSFAIAPLTIVNVYA